jgi:hypothetical protein
LQIEDGLKGQQICVRHGRGYAGVAEGVERVETLPPLLTRRFDFLGVYP